MVCYVIVTCHSMLWTLLTVVTTLSTLYCLSSANWISGYERPYDGYKVTVDNRSLDIPEEEYYYMRKVEIPTYQPTIGLYSRCVRVVLGGQSVMSCSSFASSIGSSDDSFPVAWQVSLVLSGIASLLLSFIFVCSLLSLCVRDFCKKSLFTISGLIQVFSGLFLSVAIAIYPAGWSSTRLKYFCGADADAYHMDRCSIGWAYIVIIVCTVCIFFTGMLSIKADSATSKDEIEEEILEGKHLICIK